MHDFVDEGDQSGDGKMTFEEFAAFVRSKEISLQNAYESLNPDAKGRIRGSRLKKNLGNMEIRAGRYNSRKKIRRKGIEKMLQYVEDEQVLNANDFRDLMILIPENQLQTVSPYYMKVGLDIGTRRLPIPDRRKDGKPWGHLLAGGIAGIASKTVSSPLNVVAVRSIAGEGGASRISAREMWSTMSHIARTEGIGGLFKGNMSNCISSAPGKAIDFFRLRSVQGSAHRQRPRTDKLGASARGFTGGHDLRQHPVSAGGSFNPSDHEHVKDGSNKHPTGDGGDCEERGDPRSIQRLGRGDGGRGTVCRYIFRLLRHPERAVQEIRSRGQRGSSSNARDWIHFRFFGIHHLVSTLQRHGQAADRNFGARIGGQAELSERDKVHDRQGWVQRVVQRLASGVHQDVPAGWDLVCCVRDGQTAARSIQLRGRRGGRGHL